jgi:hypothetical protein
MHLGGLEKERPCSTWVSCVFATQFQGIGRERALSRISDGAMALLWRRLRSMKKQDHLHSVALRIQELVEQIGWEYTWRAKVQCKWT